jgi:hypothetical protein
VADVTELLCILLKPALYGVSNPKQYWYLLPFTLLAWIVDAVLAHTAWPLIAGWPHPHELTISDTLERLCKDTEHPSHLLFVEIAKAINRVCPTHDHIKALAAPKAAP